jgi:hypothetical protein
MKSRRLLRSQEIENKYGIPILTLKHLTSDRYKGIKPPTIPIGKTKFFPEDQFDGWYQNEIRGKNKLVKSAKSAKSVKLVK